MQHLSTPTAGIEDDSVVAVFANSDNMREARSPGSGGYTEDYQLGTWSAREVEHVHGGENLAAD